MTVEHVLEGALFSQSGLRVKAAVPDCNLFLHILFKGLLLQAGWQVQQDDAFHF